MGVDLVFVFIFLRERKNIKLDGWVEDLWKELEKKCEYNQNRLCEFYF